MIPRASAIMPPQTAGKAKIETKFGFDIVKNFEPTAGYKEGIIDLSHCPKTLIQGTAIDKFKLELPGQAEWLGSAWIGRFAQNEAIAFCLTDENMPIKGEEKYYTDMTDAWSLIGVIGQHADEVMNRLVSVDIERPEIEGPVCLVANSHAIRVRIINPKNDPKGFLLACDRPYGQSLYDMCVHYGSKVDLKPVGEETLISWLEEQGLQNK